MKKLTTKIMDNWKYILTSIICILVCILTFIIEMGSYEIGSRLSSYKYIIILLIIVIGTLFSYFINKVYKKNIKLENLFLAIIIPLGLLYMIVMPLGRVPDENNHFYRSYEVSQVKLISKKNKEGYGGNYLPSNITEAFTGKTTYSYEIKNSNIKTSKKTKFINYSNTALYSFINYIPQAIGILLGRIFNLPIFWLAVLGRLSNFLIWTLLMYFSIKFIPYKKLSLLIMILSPMMLQEAASLSADALTNGSIFFFIAYILYLRNNKNKQITNKNMVILYIITIIMSVCKIVYLPLCLLVFLLPEKKFKTKKEKYIKILVLAIIVIIVSGSFFVLSTGYKSLNSETSNINMALQLKYIIQNPVTYILTLFRTIYIDFNGYISGFIGENLCWFDVSISSMFYRLICLLFVLIAVLDSTKIDNTNKLLQFIVSALVILLIFTSEYLAWTDVYSNVIKGVQGRYFIPLTIPLLLLFNLDNLKFDLNKIYKYLLIIIVNINLSVLITLFAAHF